jgi:hypothetical protein
LHTPTDHEGTWLAEELPAQQGRFLGPALIAFSFLALATFAAACGSRKSWAGFAEILVGLHSIAALLLAGTMLVIAIALHECVHWLCAFAAGGRPRICTASIDGRRYPSVAFDGLEASRCTHIGILVAPTVVITALGTCRIALSGQFAGPICLALAFHIGGCGTDWRMALRLAQLPQGSRVVALNGGYRVHGARTRVRQPDDSSETEGRVANR